MSALPKIDIHLHLAGTGSCASGCHVDKRLLQRYTFRALRLLYRVSDSQLRNTFDSDWPARLEQALAAADIDYGVALGFDGAYDPNSGEPIPKDTQMVVPADWVFKVARKHRHLLPGPSINPYRQNAMDLLEAVIEQGAVLIKWLPPAQAIDPADNRIVPFYRRLAQAGVPLLVHVGGERTFRTLTNEFNGVDRLRLPLELGVTVIAAHSATSIVGGGEKDQFEALKTLLSRYANLWVDNSGLCNPSRFVHLPRLAQDPVIAARTLYGSDFPVPANAFYYVGQLSLRQIVAIERLRGSIARDIAVKRAFGYPDFTLTRAANVLAHLNRWIKT